MTGFVLNYGTVENGHVEMDFVADTVRYWPPGDIHYIEMSIDGFAQQYPELVKEMVDNGVLRPK